MSKYIYITPNVAFTTGKITNPYLTDLAAAWEEHGVSTVRSKHVSRLGIADFSLYLYRTDILMLNWPEDLYHRRLGYLQSVIFRQLLKIFKLRGGKVVWTMHNKVSHHSGARNKQKGFIEWLIKESDLVIVHAEEGLELAKHAKKSLYYPHPFKPFINHENTTNDFEYDALIWGNISPYKGIHDFLEFLYRSGKERQFKILICGDCKDKVYANKILQYQLSNISIQVKFLSDHDLSLCFQKSRTVLFTHIGESVLTSGTLAESLSHGKTVIAPNRGNFKDFAKRGLLYTYDSFDEVPGLLSACQADPEKFLIPRVKIKEVISIFNWSYFVDAIRGKM